MFSNIKKIILYSTIIAVPFGLIALVFKYFYSKSNGKDVSVEEMATEAISVIRKIINFFKTIKK